MAHYERDSIPWEHAVPAPGLVRLRGIPYDLPPLHPDPATFFVIPVPGGALGTEATAKVMARLALEAASDPYFLDRARAVVRNLPDRDYAAYEDAILRYVCDPVVDEELDAIRIQNRKALGLAKGDTSDFGALKPRIRYREGPIAENANGQMLQYLGSPGWTWFVSGEGLCADMATLISAMDGSVGLGSTLRNVATDASEPGRYSHVYTVAVGGDRVPRAQDPVPKSPRLGKEPPLSIQTAPPIDFTVALP